MSTEHRTKERNETGRTTSYRMLAEMSAHSSYAHDGTMFATADSYAGRVCQDVHVHGDAAVVVRTYPEGAMGPFATVTVESEQGNVTLFVNGDGLDTVRALRASLLTALEHVNR